LKENLQSVTEYAEYIAESINENLVVEEEGVEAGVEVEDLEKDVEVGNNSEEGNVEGEEAAAPAEELDSELDNSEQDVAPEGDDAEDKSAELKSDLEGKADDAGKEVAEAEEVSESCDKCGEATCVCETEEVSRTEAYKNEISEKLNTLVEAATKKENENPSFFKVVSSKVQEKYNALNEDAKKEVRYNVSKRGFMTESQIESLIESSTLIVENRNAAPYFIEVMPTEYKETWEALSEGKQNQIKAQANYHRLETEYQVRNFWQTRDLRETAPKMEKIEMVAESKKEEEANGLGYDVSNYATELKKRFKK